MDIVYILLDQSVFEIALRIEIISRTGEININSFNETFDIASLSTNL